MEQPLAVRSNKCRLRWWEYPTISLIVISAVPAYAAFLMAIIGWGILAFHPAFLERTNMGGRLQAWSDVSRFLAMASGPVGVAICIVVSVASFRSRATKVGWLIIIGGILGWFAAGALIGKP
jgi:hypothetical protein